ncbi:MAG: DNA polymerase III subunit gamma/tau, partial [Firmicutes bacterium]|nr:DNA polymerase III subunit gamma/tau [Bacillota bacterium]MTI70704.1 DNA polymerase III subunit gamma/tau [Bacillota bacterium]
MGYQALYRKFRPRTFDEVLGQEHITTILKNQILNDNIAHAYLFSGTRGTGKTSTAKIFARAVNCENNTNGNPCNECEVCKKIQDESIMDVVEMDAASNNSVDDIRELREKVKYLPSKGRYKVYIIDEVHMLSKGAFNALLKTLEEPPKHLLFILATTEPQKLPATILSRCQRYDFKRLNMKDIVDNMKTICNDIDVEIEDRGLHLIARNADGAMRDALSILDQCVSFAEGKITHDYILSILGTVNNDVYFDMADHIINKDLNKALELIEYIVLNGKDIKQFIKDLI